MWGQRCNANHCVYVPLWCFLDSWLLVPSSLSCLMCLPSDCNVMWDCNFCHPIGRLIFSIVVCKVALWFSITNCSTLCRNASSCSFFLFVETYQRSWFDKPLLFNNMTNNSTYKEFAMFGMKKKVFPTLLSNMNLDHDKMWTSFVHPCIQPHSFIHQMNFIVNFHFYQWEFY
jgi:hypothetical protein